MAQLYPVSGIGQLLKLSPRRIQQLVKDGILPRPVQGQYEPIGCVHAYIEYLKKLISGSGELSLTDERTRLTKYQADLAELELAKSRGEVIPRVQAERVWGSIITTTRQQLLGLSVKLAPHVVAAKSLPEAKELVEHAIHEVLSELQDSTTDYSGQDAVPEGDELLPSPTEIDRQRVGRREQKVKPGKQRRAGPVENESC